MTTLSKLNYVNVGKHGTFAPSGSPLFDTTAADVDKIFESLKDGDRLLLYFHGGLVNTQSGMETAERITRYVTTGTQSHPVSFVWETGLIDTVKQNLDVIWSSDFFKRLLVKVVKVAGKNLGIDVQGLTGSKGVGGMSDEQIWEQLKFADPFENTVEILGKRSVNLQAAAAVDENLDFLDDSIGDEIKAEMEVEIENDQALIDAAANEKPPLEAELMRNSIAENSAAGEKGILSFAKLIAAAVKIVIAVVKRYMKKRNHDFYPTVVEEILREIYIADIGTLLWGLMQTKAKDMWKADDFTGDPIDFHAGSYFLKKIVDFQSTGAKLTIDLVGHSAGSIAICELVDAVVKRGLNIKFRHIIFMAPACRCELFADTILKNRTIMEDFRIFTMSDEFEKKDHLVPVIYPRSLLYLISGILEKDNFDAYILGLQRHITGAAPYDEVEVLNNIKAFVEEEGHIVYAVTKEGALAGFISGSMKHGNFDNDKETTLDSIVNIIK
ncbi:hypothetical protein ACS5PU_07010 [Pedobacter sp. GSP4]|uniref:hypothetical protein n=1 Tax=Pedobacter sp. GSP4 TaxID=3453716 RepID=UPI003EEE3CC3